MKPRCCLRHIALIFLVTLVSLPARAQNPPPPVIHLYALTGEDLYVRPFGVVKGPDSAIWFTDQGSNQIGRLCTEEVAPPCAIGAILDLYPVLAGGDPAGIAVGPDGSLWFAEYAGDLNNVS